MPSQTETSALCGLPAFLIDSSLFLFVLLCFVFFLRFLRDRTGHCVGNLNMLLFFLQRCVELLEVPSAEGEDKEECSRYVVTLKSRSFTLMKQ